MNPPSRGAAGAWARVQSAAAFTRATRADEAEVAELRSGRRTDAALDPHILVLMREVLGRLGEPGSRIAAVRRNGMWSPPRR
jgi:hypothetical protein